MPKDTFRADFRRSLITGFAALFPAILTIVIIVQLYRFIDSKIGKPVNAAIKAQLQTDLGKSFLQHVLQWSREDVENSEILKRKLDKRFPSIIGLSFGFLLSLLAIYVVGRLLTFFLGRKLFNLLERVLARFPIVKVIYPYAKQVTDFLFADRKVKFSSVVAIEYPRKGVFALGFLTNEGVAEVRQKADQPLMSIFIPSSPTPVTGYVVMVPERDIMPLDMTVDEAIRYTISGGVLVPQVSQRREFKKISGMASRRTRQGDLTNWTPPTVKEPREERMSHGNERSE